VTCRSILDERLVGRWLRAGYSSYRTPAAKPWLRYRFRDFFLPMNIRYQRVSSLASSTSLWTFCSKRRALQPRHYNLIQELFQVGRTIAGSRAVLGTASLNIGIASHAF